MENEFPLKHRDAAENDIHVSVIGFQDKITVMVSKRGKLGKLYSVPLRSSLTGGHRLIDDSGDPDLDPLSYLTPTPLLGGRANTEDIQGNLYASHIASLISRQAPEESRTVVVGLAGDIGPRFDSQDDTITTQHKEEMLLIIKLVQACRIW